MEPTVPSTPVNTTIHVKSVPRCTHSRIVDEVRTPDGMKTGRLVCLECFAEFPDPDCQMSGY